MEITTLRLSQFPESLSNCSFMGVRFHYLCDADTRLKWWKTEFEVTVAVAFLSWTHWSGFLGPFPAPVLLTVQSQPCSLIRSPTEIMYLPRFCFNKGTWGESTEQPWILKYQDTTVFADPLNPPIHPMINYRSYLNRRQVLKLYPVSSLVKTVCKCLTDLMENLK